MLLWEAEQTLQDQVDAEYGDLIVLTIGEPIGGSGGSGLGTNARTVSPT